MKTTSILTRKHLRQIPITTILGTAGLIGALSLLTNTTANTGPGQWLITACCLGLLLMRRPSREILALGIALLAFIPIVVLLWPYSELSNAFSIYAFIVLFFGVVAAMSEALRIPYPTRLQHRTQGWIKVFFKKFSKPIAKRKRDV